MTDWDPADKTPAVGRPVVYAGIGDTTTTDATIVDADPDRYIVDLLVDDAGGILQHGVRWWTGRWTPPTARIGKNYAWPTGVVPHPSWSNNEVWAGDAMRPVGAGAAS